MDISFGTACERAWSTGTISFAAPVDGRLVRNCIAEEALTDCFDGHEGEDTLLIFERNRGPIEARARDKIDSGDVNESGGADLIPGDFEA